MQRLAEICIRRPVLASVIILMLCVIGLVGYSKLGTDRFPVIEFPFVVVSTTLPGAAPEEIETEITDKLEASVNTISGIENLRSVSSEGVSLLLIEFLLDKNADVAASEVRDRVAQVAAALPEDADPPVVQKFNPTAIPVARIAVYADAPLRDVTEYADKVLRRRMESISGVGQIELQGGEKRQINILLDPLKLRAHGLTVADARRAVASENAQIPGGSLEQGATEFSLRTMGRVERVEDLARLPLGRIEDRIVTLAEVAEIVDGSEEVKSAAQFNEKPAVLLNIRKQSDASTVDVADRVRERLEELRPTIPKGYQVKQVASDSSSGYVKTSNGPKGYEVEVVGDESVFIRAATHSVQEHLILGSLLAAVVVFFFLANWRTTLIAAISIPTSIISTFGLMWYMGFTLNVLTLLALTLSVGIVVDDAIVVLENIYRYIDEKGYSPFEAAIAATREIGFAVISITLSLVAVFLPIAFMGGIVGQFMKSFGITMSFAIGVSLLVSFTLAPMLGARLLRKSGPSKEGDAAAASSPTAAASSWSPDQIPEAFTTHAEATEAHRISELPPAKGFYGYIERGYMALLRFCMRHRWVVVLACAAAILSLGITIPAARKNFLPVDDESQFEVGIRAAEGTSVQATQALTARVARDVRQYQGVAYTVSFTEKAAQGIVYVKLTPAQERAFHQSQMMDFIRREVMPKYQAEGIRTNVSEAGRAGQGGVRDAEVMWVIAGPDLGRLNEYSKKTMEMLAKVKDAADVDRSMVLGKPEIRAVVDRERAAELGVSVSEVARTLRTLVAGERVSEYSEAGEQYEVHIRSTVDQRTDPEALALITIPSNQPAGAPVPLGDVVKFVSAEGPSQIDRQNRQRQVTIYSNLSLGASQQNVLDAINNEIVPALKFEPGYSGQFAGASKEMNKAFVAFLVVFFMSFAFMYLVIAAQFESWIHPITILLSLPLTLPFALIAVILFRESLNIFSMLGVLVLFAVVKKNSILQIDHTNQLRKKGLARDEAILAANRDRLRPILMTTVAFVAGMLPLMFSRGVGAATDRTISSVVIGGQTLSLLLTLVATPVAYSLFDDIAHGRPWKWLWKVIGKG